MGRRRRRGHGHGPGGDPDCAWIVLEKGLRWNIDGGVLIKVWDGAEVREG